MNKKIKIFIIDTSAILSGKPINPDQARMVTTPSVSSELKPGGKDYLIFQLLIEKGLTILSPSKESINNVTEVARRTGDSDRLSQADVEILALGLDIQKENETVIVTDDYSIQNVAQVLHIPFQSFAQRGITKKFKWSYRCPGCGKTFRESIKICPICGTATRTVVSHTNDLD